MSGLAKVDLRALRAFGIFQYQFDPIDSANAVAEMNLVGETEIIEGEDCFARVSAFS